MSADSTIRDTFEEMLLAAGKSEEPEKLVEVDEHCGQLIDRRYFVLEHIASGGMGSVYKAIQRPLERTVAMKFMKVDDDAREELEERFFLEACLCARLTHPNTVRIFDYGQHGEEIYYIVMEYLEGKTLEGVVKAQGAIEPLRVVRMTKQVCAALSEAHEKGLVHRDIKLSNLFLTNHQLTGDFVKVLDFGLVKQMNFDKRATRDGMALGSPLFMSPEQIQGRLLDARTDIYALGIVVYMMLTGRPPFEAGGRIGKLFQQHLNSTPAPMSSIQTAIAIPDELEVITQRAMSKDPDARFQTMREMLSALQQCEERICSDMGVSVSASATDLASLLDAEGGAGVDSGEFDDEVFAATEAFVPVKERRVPTLESCGLSPDSVTLAADELDEALSTDEQDELDLLREADLNGFVAYVDLNCPFCFALHERLTSWELVSNLTLRMIEHASHIIDGPFGADQESVLANEVYALHHRAPDVVVSLPPRRYCSRVANRLLYLVQVEHADRLTSLRDALYRALWQQGRDIGDREVLSALLREQGLSSELLERCVEDPPELVEWQRMWENADFDSCIPVLQHEPSGRVLIGLPTRRSLIEFFLEKKSRVVDSAVCYYQRRPVVLVCGSTQNMWSLIEPTRDRCEFIQTASVSEAREFLHSSALPDLLLVEEGWGGETLNSVVGECKARAVSWIVVASRPGGAGEVAALSAGAAEFLHVSDNAELALMRFERVLRDRLSVERRQSVAKTDALTGLASRRRFTRHFEVEWERAMNNKTALSLLMIDIDKFKAFNDSYGYLAGDQCLERLGAIWDFEIRQPSQILARFGGGEFVCLLPENGAQQATERAEHLRSLVSEANIPNEKSPHAQKLTISVGGASCSPGEHLSLHELLDLADESRREAQRQGGNCVLVKGLEDHGA